MRTYLEKTLHKKRAGGVTQGIGPEFKPQYHKKKKENKTENPLSHKLLVWHTEVYKFKF
jgi:hypothetical protein